MFLPQTDGDTVTPVSILREKNIYNPRYFLEVSGIEIVNVREGDLRSSWKFREIIIYLNLYDYKNVYKQNSGWSYFH